MQITKRLQPALCCISYLKSGIKCKLCHNQELTLIIGHGPFSSGKLVSLS